MEKHKHGFSSVKTILSSSKMVYNPQGDSSVTATNGPSRNKFRWTDNIQYFNVSTCVQNVVNSYMKIPADYTH